MKSEKIIAYARVSTNEQAEDKGALVKQMRRLRAVGATKIYYDVESRTSDTRRGLTKLIEDINASSYGEISKFLFIRIDRLTASNNIFYQLMDALRKKGIKPEALDEPFDLSSIGGELTIDVRLAAAKYEVKMLSMRVKKERDTRKIANKPHWNAPMGYILEGDRYKLDDREVVCLISDKKVFTYATLARFIFDSFFEIGTINKTVAFLHQFFGIEAKSTPKNTAKKPNILNSDDEISINTTRTHSGVNSNKLLKWTVSGLRNTLVNPVYAGGTPYDLLVEGKKHKKPFTEWSISWGTHEQLIITREEHELIKEIIESNRQNRWATDQKFTNPFAGILKCAYCGAAYTRQSKKLVKKQNFIRHHYQCSFYKSRACKNKTMVSSDNLDKQLIIILVKEAERLSQAGEIKNYIKSETEELKKLKSSLEDLEKIPTFPSLEKAKAELKEQINDIVRANTSKNGDYIIARERIINAFSNPLYWESLTIEEKARIIRGCVRKILVRGDSIESVEFKY